MSKLELPSLSSALFAAVASAASFVTGLVTRLLDRVIPTYTDLVQENAALRKQVRELQEEVDGMRDALEDG